MSYDTAGNPIALPPSGRCNVCGAILGTGWHSCGGVPPLSNLPDPVTKTTPFDASAVVAEEYLRLREEVATLRAGIRRAANELGVPQPGYPAPVANAAEVLAALLAPSSAPGGETPNG